MNGFSGIVLDEHMQVLSTGTVTTTTSLEHLPALTRADQIVIHGIATAETGSLAAFVVSVQTSPDGRTWVQKNPNAEINIASGVAPTEMSGWGSEPTPPNPSMGFVQLSIQLSGTAGAVVRVRIGVSGRSKTKRVKREPVQSRPPGQFRIVSETTMHEIYRHLLASSHLHGDDRVDHVLRHLSGPARQEVEAFTTKFMNMNPLVKNAIGNVTQALTNLTRMPAGDGAALETLPGAFADSNEGTLARGR